MKKITAFLAAILSFIICLGGVSPAFAQGLPQTPTVQTSSNTPSIIAVGKDNQLYTRATLTSPWVQVSNSAAVIGVTTLADGTILGIGLDNQLYTRATLTSPWVQVPNSGLVIGVTTLADGTILGVGKDNLLYTRDSLTSKWVQVPNSGLVIGVTTLVDGTILGIGLDNLLYTRATLTSPWVQVPNSAAPIAITSPKPSQPASKGITTFYLTPEQQASGVQVYQQLKYDVAIPNPDLSAMLPPNVKDFPAAYQQVLAEGRKKNGINGSFTEGWFDFQASTAVIPGTNTLFTIKDPLGSRIYSVVAGKAASECPLKINSTQIAFFDKISDAQIRAVELDSQGFLVYVSPVDKLTIKAFSQLFYDPATGNKKTNKDCFLVTGATEGVKVDFQKIFPLLPPALQQPARQAPFEYFPKVGKFIYLVNARQTLTSSQ